MQCMNYGAAHMWWWSHHALDSLSDIIPSCPSIWMDSYSSCWCCPLTYISTNTLSTPEAQADRAALCLTDTILSRLRDFFPPISPKRLSARVWSLSLWLHLCSLPKTVKKYNKKGWVPHNSLGVQSLPVHKKRPKTRDVRMARIVFFKKTSPGLSAECI